jgi:MFS family permease
LSDVFGRRNPILIGEVLVILGCFCAGFAQNIQALIAGETLIGLGVGLIFVSYAGVAEMVPNRWRALALGILEAGIALPW